MRSIQRVVSKSVSLSRLRFRRVQVCRCYRKNMCGNILAFYPFPSYVPVVSILKTTAFPFGRKSARFRVELS